MYKVKQIHESIVNIIPTIPGVKLINANVFNGFRQPCNQMAAWFCIRDIYKEQPEVDTYYKAKHIIQSQIDAIIDPANPFIHIEIVQYMAYRISIDISEYTYWEKIQEQKRWIKNGYRNPNI